MSPVAIRRVDTGRSADVRRFADLPHRLHGHRAQWVPPLWRESVSVMDERRHPYYRDSEAAFFLAVDGCEVVGRIAALDNRRHNRHRGTATGFFGYFESVDDQQVTDRLFDAAFDWLGSRGHGEVVGPRGVLGFDGTVLVDGFEHPAAIGVPWNPDYYPVLLERAGFAPHRDFLSGWLPGRHQLDPRIHAIADRARVQGGYWSLGFSSRRELRARLPDLTRLFLEGMRDTPTYYPPTPDEIRRVARTLLLIAEPRAVKLVMKADLPVGFILAYPDLAPAIRESHGKLLPLGWQKVMAARRRARFFVINGLGVLPEHRGSGANAVLYAAITRSLRDELAIERAEIVQVAEENASSIRDMQALDVRWYKRHRHVSRAL